MHHPRTTTIDATEDLILRCGYDPSSLTRNERRQLAAAMQAEQDAWLARLSHLTEPPSLETDFPAFLICTPAFDDLRDAIGGATEPSQLDTGTADELQHFVDRYRHFLR